MLTLFAAFLGLFVSIQPPAAPPVPPGPPPTPTPSALSSDPKGWVDLLADKSLKSWTRVPLASGFGGKLAAGDVAAPSPWKLDASGKVLVCAGDKSGHEMFRYTEETGDFILHAEWRYVGPPDEKAYNSGIFVRASADGAVYLQAQTGTGGGYLFGTYLADGKPARVNGRDKMAENRVKPAGEWNEYEVRGSGKTLTLWVNGAVVSEIPSFDAVRGFIGLEAEGYLVEFRNLKLKVMGGK
jgi:hypothetical protein